MAKTAKDAAAKFFCQSDYDWYSHMEKTIARHAFMAGVAWQRRQAKKAKPRK